jgi:hypothetical protein
VVVGAESLRPRGPDGAVDYVARMERFVVENSRGAISPKEALTWLLGEAASRGEGAAIFSPSVASIDNLGGLLTAEQTQEARRERKTRVGSVPVSILTPLDLPPRFEGLIFVPWSDTGTIEKAEGLAPQLLCGAGWLPEDLEAWKKTWDPVDLSTREEVGVEMSREPLIEAIVGLLTHPAGASDVTHPSDKRRAVESFKALHKVGIEFDPEAVRALARRSGWRPEAADRLHAIARKVAEGRTVQGAGTITITKAREIVTRLEAWEPL